MALFFVYITNLMTRVAGVSYGPPNSSSLFCLKIISALCLLIRNKGMDIFVVIVQYHTLDVTFLTLNYCTAITNGPPNLTCAQLPFTV